MSVPKKDGVRKSTYGCGRCNCTANEALRSREGTGGGWGGLGGGHVSERVEIMKNLEKLNCGDHIRFGHGSDDRDPAT